MQPVRPALAVSQQHLLLDLHGCDPALLTDAARLRAALIGEGAPGTALPAGRFHAFEPQGVSGSLVMDDVLLTIHTWPEQGFAAVDLFARSQIDTVTWQQRLADALGAETVQTARFRPGQD